MTDHYAESNRALQQTLNYSETDENTGALVSILAAQVHAQLALVEQQRIANLIALYVGDSKKHPAGGEIGDDAYNLLADSDVRRALRIETP